MPEDVQETTQSDDAVNVTPENKKETTPAPEQPDMFPRDYVEELRAENAKRRIREKELADQLEQVTAKQKASQEKELQEQQRWQELAEARAKELEDARKQLESERKANLRTRVGLEEGLHAELVDRIRGDDEDAMREDAKKLAGLFAAKKDTSTDSAPEDDPADKQPDNEARRRTTTAAPGGQPIGRTDEDRRNDYFRGQGNSPIFQGGGVVEHSPSES